MRTGPALGGRDLDPVGVGLAARPPGDLGRGGEHLVRADEVERGDARIDDEDDAAGHRPILRAGPPWQQ